MKQRHTRRLGVAVVLVFALGTVGGAAYGYWSAGGSGTGSGTVAVGLTDVTVNQTTVLTAMYPGDSAQTLSGNFDNPNVAPAFVTTVTVSVSSVTKDPGAVAGTCDATDFTITNATATVNTQVAPGTGVGAWTGPTIRFNYLAGTNQDACKGATVALGYAIP